MTEKLRVKESRGNHGFIIETISGRAVALTFHGGREGRTWADNLIEAFNEMHKDDPPDGHLPIEGMRHCCLESGSRR